MVSNSQFFLNKHQPRKKNADTLPLCQILRHGSSHRCENYIHPQRTKPKDITKPRIIFGVHRKGDWCQNCVTKLTGFRCDHCAECLCCLCRKPVQHLWMWIEMGACALLAHVHIHCEHWSCRPRPSAPTPFHDAIESSSRGTASSVCRGLAILTAGSDAVPLYWLFTRDPYHGL